MIARRLRPAYLAALTATLLWGANYSIAKRVLAEIDPLAVACVRAAAAGLFFSLLLVARQGFAGLSWSGLRRAAPLGIMGIALNQVLFIEGLSRTSAAHSGILIAMLPVHVLLLSILFGQETLGLAKAAGILIALSGVIVVALEKGIDFRSAYITGDLLTLGAGLAFAGYTVAGKPVLRDLGPLRTTALAFVTGSPALVLAGIGSAARQDWRAVSPTALTGLAAVILLATIVAYILYYYAISRIDPSQVAAFMYLQPVIAALVAFAVAGERLSGTFLAGGCLVLAGVLITERGPQGMLAAARDRIAGQTGVGYHPRPRTRQRLDVPRREEPPSFP